MKRYIILQSVILMLFITLGFTACSVNTAVYTPEQSHSYGFNVDEKGVLKNPPSDKARIYIMRENAFKGAMISYNIFYQYEPKTDTSNKLIVEKDAYKNNIMGNLSRGLKFYRDFDADKPLLLIAGTETKSYVIFTPQQSKIYCLEGTIEMGAWVGRPNLNFVDKTRCETLYLKTKPKELH